MSDNYKLAIQKAQAAARRHSNSLPYPTPTALISSETFDRRNEEVKETEKGRIITSLQNEIAKLTAEKEDLTKEIEYLKAKFNRPAGTIKVISRNKK